MYVPCQEAEIYLNASRIYPYYMNDGQSGGPVHAAHTKGSVNMAFFDGHASSTSMLSGNFDRVKTEGPNGGQFYNTKMSVGIGDDRHDECYFKFVNGWQYQPITSYVKYGGGFERQNVQ